MEESVMHHQSSSLRALCGLVGLLCLSSGCLQQPPPVIVVRCDLGQDETKDISDMTASDMKSDSDVEEMTSTRDMNDMGDVIVVEDMKDEEMCTQGACLCTETQAYCENECIDVQSDAMNCGSCGKTCAANERCDQGACVCEEGATVCGGVCVKLAEDSKNCGMCGMDCAEGYECKDSACVCEGGKELCDGKCVDIMDDTLHCGSCGFTCQAGVACEMGACACDPGEVTCDAECVSLTDNLEHCGACGNACELGCDGTECIKIVDLAASDDHTCVLLSTGSMYCWGESTYGILGGGASVETLPLASTAFNMLYNIKSVAMGGRFTCFVEETGKAHCIGLNNLGQLGAGLGGSSYSMLQEVKNLTNAVSIDASSGHVCVLRSDKTMQCWGDGTSGQLGDGMGRTIKEPTDVMLTDVEQMSVGAEHTCAIHGTNRDLSCWGESGAFQTGTASTMDALLPQSVNLSGIQYVSCGKQHSCYIGPMGDVYCVGSNNENQVGVQGGTSLTSWRKVQGLPAPATKIQAADFHTCALLETGEVWCWGANTVNQLGRGVFIPNDWSPAKVVGLGGVRDFVSKRRHTCAVTDREELYCWGKSSGGVLGLGSSAAVYVPVRVSTLKFPLP